MYKSVKKIKLSGLSGLCLWGQQNKSLFLSIHHQFQKVYILLSATKEVEVIECILSVSVHSKNVWICENVLLHVRDFIGHLGTVNKVQRR